jgi:uncharacterized repeat protein (TIGR03837 family)
LIASDSVLPLDLPKLSRERWDIFCKVVDNFGDIGFCWRLARQLAHEFGLDIRLWVDDLAAFAALCPEVDTAARFQHLAGVEIGFWGQNFEEIVPADVVIEAFACDLPLIYLKNMVGRARLWLNLEYLSAEDWVSQCHRLGSPHPQLGLTRYFFFPGFTPATGGLVREAGLLAARNHFGASEVNLSSLWITLGVTPPPVGHLKVSLFCYPHAPLQDLLESWADSEVPVCCFVPQGKVMPQLAQFFDCDALPLGAWVSRGQLQLQRIPFMAQPIYDQLLWACDLNWVRGEDSFVRAQWAAKPFIWQIYPQAEAAHWDKLDAFMVRYSESTTCPAAWRRLMEAWNGGNGTDLAQAWHDWLQTHDQSLRHAQNWSTQLAVQPDLASQLVNWSKSL